MDHERSPSLSFSTRHHRHGFREQCSVIVSYITHKLESSEVPPEEDSPTTDLNIATDLTSFKKFEKAPPTVGIEPTATRYLQLVKVARSTAELSRPTLRFRDLYARSNSGGFAAGGGCVFGPSVCRLHRRICIFYRSLRHDTSSLYPPYWVRAPVCGLCSSEAGYFVVFARMSFCKVH